MAQVTSFQSALIALQGNLYNFAFLLTSNRENAYDLVQDTTLKALNSQEKYTADTNFKGWVFTIMRNIFINNYRRTIYEATHTDSTENLYHLNISQDSGLSAPEGSIESMEISQLVAQLPPELFDAFTLFAAGYKYAEIAEMLSQPMGTVKTHIFQARKLLQEYLANYR